MTNQSKQQLLIWWVVWGAFLMGIFMIYFMLIATSTSVSSPVRGSLVWLAGVAPVVVSAIIRWIVLPRIWNARTALALFVVGIALAEAACFVGLFVFPAHKLELFVLSALGIFQFAPYYAGRYLAG
jgi:hypothetical protein